MDPWTPDALRTDRRDFLKLSLAGSAALSTLSLGATVTGCAAKEIAPGMKNLRPQDVELITALIPAVLAGNVTAGDEAQVKQTLISFDTLLGDLSDSILLMTRQAFDVLNFGPSRALLAGQWAGWSRASVQDAQNALERLRDSRISLLNAIYANVIRLVASAWYLIPTNAATTGYPGPPKREIVDHLPVEDSQ